MEAFQELINTVLSEAKGILLSGVNKEHEDITEKNYRKHLELLYADIYSDWTAENGDERMLIEFIKNSEMFFLQASAQDKMDLLIFEYDFDRIHLISTEALDMAMEYHKTGEKNQKYDSRKDRIISTLEKEVAMAEGKTRLVDYIGYELEEAIQDLKYASGLSTQMTQRLRDSIKEA